MLKEFKNDRNFLLRYYAVSTVVTLGALAALLHYRELDFRPSFLGWLAVLVPLIFPTFFGIVAANFLAFFLVLRFYPESLGVGWLILLPVGIYFGMLNVPVIHNCAHRNFRPRWLNRVLGEICALHLLSGYPGFVILHLLHHQHPDDPQLDPHPNRNLSFWRYVHGVKQSLGSAFQKFYVKRWGDTPAARQRWKAMRLLLSANRVLRALLMLFAFGPVAFTLVFLPSILANQLLFAHINYYTHAVQPDGSIKIVDLHETLTQRLFNRILLGMYFHGTHHRHCGLFNPARGPG